MRQGTGGREQADIARLGCTPATVQSFGVRVGTVRLQGIAEHRQLGRRGVEQAVVEVVDLRWIDRQQGEAGVELLPAVIVGVSEPVS